MNNSTFQSSLQEIVKSSIETGFMEAIRILLETLFLSPFSIITYGIIILCIIKYIIGIVVKGEPSIFKKIAFIAKHGSDKGAYGEWLTEYMIGNNRLKGYYKTLHNIYIPYKNKTSEIDVLLVHEKGIFVIESKNYSGWIFGSEEQQKWTQCLKNKQKNHFYNPISQNKTHIKALSKYLQINENNITSLIVFSERCELKKVPENKEEYIILKRNKLLKILRKMLEERTEVLQQEEINEIIENLKPLTNVSEEVKQKHIENIKENYKQD